MNRQYPIGEFITPETYNLEMINQWINEIDSLPHQLKELLIGMNEEELHTTYRENGWTVKQVVHHIADSHMNAYIRCKLSLTETIPTIKAYDESSWAALADTKDADIEPSLQIIEGLHKRWIYLLKSLNEADYDKRFFRPEMKKEMPLKTLIALYAWHGKHHLAHISLVKER